MRCLKTILTLLILTISIDVVACSCIGSSTVDKAIKGSDAVLVGTAISKEIIKVKDFEAMRLSPNDSLNFDGIFYTSTIAKYKFVVEAIYKGNIKSDTIEVFTGLGGGDCGNRFKTGLQYILYADKETYKGQLNNNYDYPKGRNQLWTNICTRTRQFDKSEIDEIEKYRKKKNN